MFIYNEQYFGKTPSLIKLESIIGDIRKQKYKNDTVVESKELAKVMKNQFGFANTNFLVDFTTAKNAYTLVFRDKLNGMGKPVFKNGTYQFNPKDGYDLNVYFSYGLLCDTSFTNEELVAILLHEIGHHFSAKAAMYEYNLPSIKNLVRGMTDMNKAIYNLTNGAKEDIRNISDANIMAGIQQAFNGLDCRSALAYINNGVVLVKDAILNGNISDAFKFLTGDKTVVNKVLNTKFDQSVKNLVSEYDTEEEKSDAFATIYGYGPALTTALTKLESNKLDTRQSTTESNVLEWILKFYVTFGIIGVFEFFIDSMAHIDSSKRTLAALAVLNQELKTANLTPKQRKRIQQDIIDITKDYESYLEAKQALFKKTGYIKLAFVYNKILFLYHTKFNSDRNLESYQQLLNLYRMASSRS
jgi:hypothetical protein